MTPFDPYQGNILVEKLGQIKSRKEISTFLTYLPKLPPNNVESIPRHIRLHMLQDVRDLHIPSLNEARLSESMDLMLRQSYKYRDPKDNSTWSNIYASAPEKKTITAPPMVMESARRMPKEFFGRRYDRQASLSERGVRRAREDVSVTPV